MDNRLRWIYRFAFLLLLFVLIYIFFKLKPVWLPFIDMVAVIFTPFIISAFITYLLHPIVEKLHENYFPRWLSILIIYLLFLAGLLLRFIKVCQPSSFNSEI